MSLASTAIALLVCLTAAEPAAAEGDAGVEVRQQMGGLLRRLDSPEFDVRRRAEEAIQRWLARPELAEVLADEFQRSLLDPQISFEVRWQLQHWLRRLPGVPLPPAEDVSTAELDRLARQLDDDSYAVRQGAARRLEWLLANGRMVCPVMLRLKARVSDPQLPAEARRRLEPLCEKARGAWLTSDPASWSLPEIPDGQIARWADDLARPAPVGMGSPWLVHQLAERELMDLLARDAYVGRVKQVLEERLSQVSEEAARARLQAVLDWLRPAMVAEYWQDRRHLGEQHLLVGEPSQAEGAQRPSHFDRIDDRVAHCVSGNSLSPGEYPSGVAFPHPTRDSAFFHLVNLPTPRRRMAYAYFVKGDEARRLAEISRRTVDRWLEAKHVLSEREIEMLAQLDAREASRFAGRYFNVIDDDPVLAADAEPGRPSRHGMICLVLATDGTREAVPGLLEAIRRGRFLEPTSNPPYRLQWCAALAIAARDPWPGVEAWLASLLDRREALLAGAPEDKPERGATAGGLLLARHRRPPDALGLRSTGPILDAQTQLQGFRFASDEAPRELRRWWEEEGRTKAQP